LPQGSHKKERPRIPGIPERAAFSFCGKSWRRDFSAASARFQRSRSSSPHNLAYSHHSDQGQTHQIGGEPRINEQNTACKTDESLVP
jgi:hypothetical protein